MTPSPFARALQTTQTQLCIEIATTPAQIREAKQLRYRVYCEERGYEPGDDGLEQDEFDNTSHHVLLRNRATGTIYGTVRVVRFTPGGPGVPMQRVCQPDLFKPLPLPTTAEISRFALTRDRTGLSPEAAALARICLIRGITQVSGQQGLTHWCATMERTLLRLLRSSAICFRPVGPLIDYHGIRQPAVWTLSTGFDHIRREQPELWAFLTNNGEFLAQPAAEDRISAAA